MKNRRRSVGFSLAYMLLIFIVFFIAAEAFTRAFVPIHPQYDENVTIHRLSSNPKLVYELAPNVSGRWNAAYVEINSDGLRDHEYAVEKPEGVYRIAAVGDSTTFGAGVDNAYTYPKLLEKKLNDAAGQKYEVINFGVSGYNTEQEKERIREKVMKYGPDAIIIGYVLNDIDPAIDAANSTKSDQYSFFYKNLQFLPFFKNVVLRAFENRQAVIHEDLKNRYGNGLQVSSIRKEFSDIRSMTNNKPVIIAIFPIPIDFKNYAYYDVHQQIYTLAEDSGFHVVDLAGPFNGLDVYRYVVHPLYDQHFNKAGNEIIAQTLFDYLRQNITDAS